MIGIDEIKLTFKASRANSYRADIWRVLSTTPQLKRAEISLIGFGQKRRHTCSKKLHKSSPVWTKEPLACLEKINPFLQNRKKPSGAKTGWPRARTKKNEQFSNEFSIPYTMDASRRPAKADSIENLGRIDFVNKHHDRHLLLSNLQTGSFWPLR